MKMVNLCRNVCNIVGLSILAVLAMILLVWGSYWFRIYLERYVEKNPEVILAAVEKEYQIVFPGNMNEVHAARTIAREGAHSVIIKFTAERAIVETFIMSLGAEDPNQFTPYTHEEGIEKPGYGRCPGGSWSQ